MKLTKKIVSLLLAIMMVVTAFPITVFAEDTTDPEVANLQHSIDEYEQLMDGSTVYKYMTPAYEAYLQANAGLDSYVYGGDKTINLRDLNTALVNAYTTMRNNEFKPYTGTKRGSFKNDGDGFNTDYYYNQVYRNLLWVKQGMTEDDYEWDATYPAGRDDFTAEATFGIKDVTMLYDGVTKPRFGTTIRLWGQEKPNITWNFKNLRLHYAYIVPKEGSTTVSSSGLQFIGAWHGKDGEAGKRAENFQWNYFADGHNPGTCTISQQTQTCFNEMNQAVIANIMEYSPSALNPERDGLMLSYNPIVYYNMGHDKGNNSYYYTYKSTIRVFNYKAITTVINDKQALLKNIKSYKQGGLLDVFKLYDTLTVDPNSFFTSSNNYAACEDHYTSAYSQLNGTSVNDLQKDDDKYQALRDAIKNTQTTANLPEDEQKKFTEESWTAFANAFDDAQKFAKDIKDVKYTNGDLAESYANALNEAYDALEILYVACDVVDLQGAIDDALVAMADPSFFIADTYKASNIEVNTPLAQKAVWGSVEDYGIKNKVLPWSEDNQATVDAWTETVGEGIALLEISTYKVLASAGMYSLESALQKAKTYKPEDYANYAELSAAIYDAEHFEKRVIADTSDTSKLENGMVSKKVEEYKDVVENLYIAIRNLKPAFSKIQNGTFASSKEVRDDLHHTPPNTTGAWWILNWDHLNDIIIFRTTHDAVNYDLGKSKFEWNCSRMYDQYLETLNFNSNPDFASGEITVDADLPEDKLQDYVGLLELERTGYNIKWSNFVVDSYNVTPDNGNVGKDRNGVGYAINEGKIWDEELLIPMASHTNPCSGIIVHGNDKIGSTYFTSDTTLSLDESESLTLSQLTRPKLTTCSQKNWWGAYFFWEYKPFWHYAGLGYMQEPYELNVNVIDVAYLFELINECNTYEYRNYTLESWNDFTEALTKANSDMNYGAMSAGDILKECQTRYDNLWNAKSNLVEAATNDSIDNALVPAREIKANYEAGVAHYSPASYAVFTTAFDNAVAAINGDYSDAKCRNLLKDDVQEIIDGIAQDLLDAIDALVPSADFSKIDEAVATKLLDKTYKTSDLEELNNKLGEFYYLTMTDEERFEVYADDQDKVDAEAAEIEALMLSLSEAVPVDTSTLEALKAEIDAKVSDPDAYEGVQAAKDFIDHATDPENLYAEIDVYGQKVIGIKYTQDETDKLVEEALTMLTAKEYKVYVKTDDDEDFVEIGTYGYGEEFNYGFDSKVDIYQSFDSVSAQGAYKFVTTSDSISFVVKGNTYITAKSATKQASYKVTIINAITNVVSDIAYVESMSGKFQLPAPKQIAYYDFVGYTVNGKSYDEGDVIDVKGDTFVFAEYELQEAGEFTLNLFFDAGEDGDDSGIVTTYTSGAYNNKVELSQEGFEHYKYISKTKSEGAYYYVDGEQVMQVARNVDYKQCEDDIYAYAILDTVHYDIDEFGDMYTEYNEGFDPVTEKQVYSDASENFPGALKIVSYDKDYSFYLAGDMTVVALTQKQFNFATEAGLIATDENGSDLTVTEPISFVGKSSIISTYAVAPEARYIEGGILFATDASVTDFSFSKVDNTKLFRLKSTEQTVGNQFVINIKQASTAREVKYVSYVIYEVNGKQVTIFTNPVDATIEAVQA